MGRNRIVHSCRSGRQASNDLREGHQKRRQSWCRSPWRGPFAAPSVATASASALLASTLVALAAAMAIDFFVLIIPSVRGEDLPEVDERGVLTKVLIIVFVLDVLIDGVQTTEQGFGTTNDTGKPMSQNGVLIDKDLRAGFPLHLVDVTPAGADETSGHCCRQNDPEDVLAWLFASKLFAWDRWPRLFFLRQLHDLRQHQVESAEDRSGIVCVDP
mmetsp:Transcript_119057/g.336734  ORF Transcript_119057/g.336734 Transcript_119057/m.336734 type:complete len:215 (-) Transcript_119057:296-940(-)